MTKDELKAALRQALDEHQTNNAAVQETTIPAGLDAIVARALADALQAKLTRLFDPTV